MQYNKIQFICDEIQLEIQVSMVDETAWLSKEQIGILFERDRSVISRHINKIFKDGELDKSTSVQFLHTSQGKTKPANRPPEYYNIDVILAVGYRLKSNKGRRLKEFVENYLKDKKTNKNEDVIIYNNGEINLSVSVSPNEETVWMNQTQMSLLFETTQQNISEHIKNIISDGELDDSVHKESLYTAQDGKTYSVLLYNLDLILAVGYRVKSKRAIQFRQWASNILKQYLLKGYALNSNRVTISQDNFVKLENELLRLKNEMNEIKEKMFVEPIKERLFFDGQYFDAYEFMVSLVAKASEQILIIDPFLDLKGLCIFKKVSRKIQIIACLSNRAKLTKAEITLFNKQYANLKTIRKDNIHDRFLILDNKECYSLGTSLNYMGNKVFDIHKIEDKDIIDAITLKASKTI